jgi:predicted AlkP superfamily pyrophosphatase or phosphodiesterase
MQKTVVINVVGLSKRFLGDYTPFLKRFFNKYKAATIEPVLPAVTCSAQSTYLTGKWPEKHGVVGNGWYFREECEVKFWKQSNKLVYGNKIWDIAREKAAELGKNFTCANMFWWYNMYSSVDYSVTPRPNYLADGSKIPDCYSQPASLREYLQKELGEFPLFNFWGPNANIISSRWIADASILTDQLYDPSLTLVYLPHLDYCLQKYGHDLSRISYHLLEIDEEVEKLVRHFESKDARIVILSEYGITEVNNPIHLNRILRENGLLAIREERGLELLDAGASEAFAVADHQIAHVYVNNKSRIEEVKQLLSKVKGVEKILDRSEQELYQIGHDRAGELIIVADQDSWFTYYYWMDEDKAPDFARMVDIHKKPGYDPVEMFADPNIKFLMPLIAGKLLKKKLGFRTVLDIIPLDATLVKGSHGRIPEDNEDHPLFMTNDREFDLKDEIKSVDVAELLLSHLFSLKMPSQEILIK